MSENEWLTLLSAAALAFSVLNYVLLDGTDLGVGVLLGLTLCGKQRRASALQSCRYGMLMKHGWC